MGADDRRLREGLDEAAEDHRRGAPLASVGMPHRLRRVRQDGHPRRDCRLHHGRHDRPVAQVEALRVRVQLTDARQPGSGASLHLSGGFGPPPRVDGAIAPQPQRKATHRVDQVVVRLTRQAGIVPANAHHDGQVHGRAVHGGHKFLGVRHTRAGV